MVLHEGRELSPPSASKTIVLICRSIQLFSPTNGMKKASVQATSGHRTWRGV